MPRRGGGVAAATLAPGGIGNIADVQRIPGSASQYTTPATRRHLYAMWCAPVAQAFIRETVAQSALHSPFGL